MSHVKEHIFCGLCFRQADVDQVVILSVAEGHQHGLDLLLNLCLCPAADRDINDPGVIAEDSVVLVLGRFDDGLERRVCVKELEEGLFETVQVNGFIQLIGKRQVASGVSGNDIGEIHHNAGQRICRAHAVIDLLLSLFLQDQLFQLQDRIAIHKFCEGHTDVQPRLQFLDEHDTCQRIQAVAVEVHVCADRLSVEDVHDDVVNLLLQLCDRAEQTLLFLRILCFFIKECLTNDLFGRGLFERILTDIAGGNFGVGRKLLVFGGNDLIERSLDIIDAVDLGIFVIGIDLDRDAVSLAVSDDVLNQSLTVKFILDQLGRDVFSVAEDDQVLLAAGQIEISVLIHVAQVTGAQPAVFRDGFSREFGVIDVSHHHRGALDLDLSVHEADLTAAHGSADRGDLVHVAIVRSRNLGRTLGHAVALGSDHTQLVQSSCQSFGEITAAADDLVQSGTHDLGFQIIEVLFGMLFGGDRDAAQEHLCHHGNDPHHGGLEQIDVVEELGDIVAQAEGTAVAQVQKQVAADTEHVMDGKHTQAGLPGIIGTEHVVEQVAVGKHNSLPVSCRAGCEDDQRAVFGLCIISDRGNAEFPVDLGR